jgi:hypothetical protein
MTRYIVYSHMLPSNRATYKTIHDKNCSYTKQPDGHCWDGYFYTLDDAETFAHLTHRETDDIRRCKQCLSSS